jgi:hypothetical protein
MCVEHSIGCMKFLFSKVGHHVELGLIPLPKKVGTY